MYTHGERPPADHSILLLACLGGALVLAVTSLASYLTSRAEAWLFVGPGGIALLFVVVLVCWTRVRSRGFYHARAEDEDGDEDGDGGARRPPDDPEDPFGDGTLLFDWDTVLVDFWAYVERRPALV